MAEEPTTTQPRPTPTAVWMQVARTVAQRATCPRLSAGAVIVSPLGHILTTGYNGSPAGTPHCTEVGCIHDTSGRCKRAVHAEMNAILQAARHGVSIEGATLYVTARPCPECTVVILNSGITEVYFGDEYPHPAWGAPIQSVIAASAIRFHEIGGQA